MKISSKSAHAAEVRPLAYFETDSLLKVSHLSDLLPLKLLDRIGTAIAIGESGDLDAAHEFRQKNLDK
jgi:hypothetical protein